MVASGSSKDNSAVPLSHDSQLLKVWQVAWDAGLHADSIDDDDSQAQHWRPIARQAVCQEALCIANELVPLVTVLVPPSSFYWPGHLEHCQARQACEEALFF